MDCVKSDPSSFEEWSIVVPPSGLLAVTEANIPINGDLERCSHRRRLHIARRNKHVSEIYANHNHNHNHNQKKGTAHNSYHKSTHVLSLHFLNFPRLTSRPVAFGVFHSSSKRKAKQNQQ